MSRLLFCAVLAIATPAFAAPRLQGLPDKQETARTIALDADIACAPDRAYRMWTTAEGARSFFAPAAEIGDRAGGPYTIMFFPDEDPQGRVHGTRGAHLLAAEPGHFLAFEWVTFAGADNKGDNAPPYAGPELRLPATLPTWVEITLTPAGTGTHVAFRHYGFGEGELWGRSHAWFSRAWAGVIERMRMVCGR
jgi:uncharacterized protein YndB with AHSA1/START domain